MNLNPRQQKILWATIRHYITTAEPVGSKALVEEYDLRISPATIRNSFSLMEKAGLLYQPHTSAGRVPSDSGYRLYVDRLLQPDLVAGQRVEQQLSTQLDWEKWSLEALLRGAAQILASLSGYIAIVTPPTDRDLTIRYLQLMAMGENRLMVVVVFDAYQSQSVVLELPPTELTAEAVQDELCLLSGLLEHHVCHRSLRELEELNWNFLSPQLQRYLPALKNTLATVQQRNYPRTQVMMRGFSEVLRQPEFSELAQVKTLLQLLEAEPEQIWQLIVADGTLPESWQNLSKGGSRISIRIGTENAWEPMHICTLVSSSYCPDGKSIGSVSLLGPKRMLYENVIPLVQATADYMSEAFSLSKQP
jgi:heat-inducible transcriptional repressor